MQLASAGCITESDYVLASPLELVDERTARQRGDHAADTNVSTVAQQRRQNSFGPASLAGTQDVHDGQRIAHVVTVPALTRTIAPCLR